MVFVFFCECYRVFSVYAMVQFFERLLLVSVGGVSWSALGFGVLGFRPCLWRDLQAAQVWGWDLGFTGLGFRV